MRIGSGRPCFFLALLLWLPLRVDGQEAAPVRNALYAELFGQAFYGGSINYERTLTPQFSARLGVSPFGLLPVMLNYLPGEGDYTAEVGLGVLAGSGDNLLGTATLGYRYHPQYGGIVLRIGWTPFFGAGGVGTWGGASVGFAF